MKLYDWLKVAPYQVDEQIIDDDEFSSARGIRVMGVAFSNERQVITLAAFSSDLCVILS
jgi:transcription elongation factor SPT6